ncbi:MAG TPA: DUF4232 domain-containing protein [Streptosporangiaceae bacterium]|nr:DUF4232 domain-containing protein [Streptosporangiaceae bacterium]
MFPRAEYSATRDRCTRRGLAAMGGRSAAVSCRMAAALICLAAVAACASSSSSPATSSSSAGASSPAAPASTTAPATAPSSSQSPAVAGPSACPNGSLQVKLGLGQGYAGGTYQVIDFTNTSGTTCTLYGYPGVSLASGPPYTQIGLAAKRTNTAPVKQITLAPGATANAVVQIVDALNFPTTTCSPVKSTNMRVFPPNQTISVYLPYASYGCSKSVQTLFIAAVQAGSGGSS